MPPRSKPMVLLCFGLPRTGTTSLRAALKELGIWDVYHYNRLLEHPADCPLWLDAFDLKFGSEGENGDAAKGLKWTAEQWDALLGDCMAISDNPCVSFAPELLAAYPDALVLLQVRDSPDAWYKSFGDTILPVEEAFHLPTWNPLQVVRRWFQYRSSFLQVNDRIAVHSPTTSTRFRTQGRELYLAHLENIRGLCSEGGRRLLEWNVKQGWGPLCEFLGKEVPREVDGEVKPFPRLNDTEEFRRLWKQEEQAFYAPSNHRTWSFSIGVLVVVGAAAVIRMGFLRTGTGWMRSTAISN